jgi:hypothetical protein
MERAGVGLLLCLAACGCPTTDDPWAGATFEPLSGEGGVALCSELPDGDWTVEAIEPGAGPRLVPLEAGGLTIDPDGAADTVYRLTPDGGDPAEFTPAQLSLIDSSTPTPALLLAGDVLQLDLALDAGDATLARGDLLVRRVADDGQVSFFNPNCAGDATLAPGCWIDDAEPLVEDLGMAELAGAAQQLPPYGPVATEPRGARFGLFLRITDGQGREVLMGEEIPAVFLGAALVFGDPHAHSNFSDDGCEDVEASCADRGDSPAEDFFDNAVAAGLDFAALTDHGEWDVLQTEGQPPLEIWPATLDVVERALPLEEAGFVPLLGYEWSNFVEVWEFMDPGDDGDDYREFLTAGHKTVLFRQTSACAGYRVGAPGDQDSITKGDSGQTYTRAEDSPAALTTGEFRQRMDEAAAACGEQTWMTFFHHPAYLVPSAVDWALPDNEPDPTVERLVEIASEHGSSECRDAALDGCGFWADDADFHQHLGWGSAQEALALGYRLGFLGGTDSHDGRPGSLDDGPCSVGIFQDTNGDGTAEPLSMFHDGAITGVYLAGELGRVALWDALWERHTLATTGPRGRLAMAALTDDGLVAMPGEELPADAFPLRLLVAVDPGAPYEVDRVEVIEPDGGSVVLQAKGGVLSAELVDPGTDAVYVRARVWDGGDEHRVWFSPLFIAR